MVIDGILYGLGSFAGGVLAAWLTGVPLVAVPFFVFGAFCMYFFRDPDRTVPAGADAVSPADGKVMAVKPEDAGLTRISIFLNVFDVHVNRSPVGGRDCGCAIPQGGISGGEQGSCVGGERAERRYRRDIGWRSC